MLDAGRSFRSFVSECDLDGDVDAPGAGPVALASFSFDTRSPESVVTVPRCVVGTRDGQWWLTTVDDARLPEPAARDDGAGGVDRARYAGSSVPDVMWLDAVAEAVTRIERGEVEKVVLARDYAVWSRTPFVPSRLLGHLADRFPACHVFRLAGLIGASPELLVRRREERLESVVLAGSAPVFDDPDADAAAGAALLDSDKDRREHRLAVDSVRRSLEPIARHLDVAATPELLRLDNVHHLATPVQATVADVDVVELVHRLHPTAAVGGTPTAAALALIDELEGMDRGRYAGPVGWFDGRGDGDFAIALRCAELSGARARLFAGAGIVAGSLPEDELEETRIKLGAMMGALEAR